MNSWNCHVNDILFHVKVVHLQDNEGSTAELPFSEVQFHGEAHAREQGW